MLPILTQTFDTMQRTSSISFPMFGEGSINPPPYFTVFGFDIYFYGLFIAIGFLAAIAYCCHISPRFGLVPDDVYDLMLWLIPLAILGARLYYVAFRLDYYLLHPGELFALRDGGLAIYGGIIAGVLSIVIVSRRKKIPTAAMLDTIIPGLLIGQIFGRMGNFMNREAFGGITDVFCRMGLTTPEGVTIYVHPTFMYEMLWNLVLFIFLAIWVKKGKRRYDGQVTCLYFLWYGIGRAWIEGLRTDSLYIGNTGIRVSQALSIALVLIFSVVLLYNARREHPAEKLHVNAKKQQNDEAQAKQET